MSYRKSWQDIDWVVVDCAIYEGRPGHMTIGERFAATVELSKQGFSQVQIAERLGITDRTVDRLLKRYREGQRVDF